MILKWKDSPKSGASSYLRVRICCASVSPDPKQGKDKLLCFCDQCRNGYYLDKCEFI